MGRGQLWRLHRDSRYPGILIEWRRAEGRPGLAVYPTAQVGFSKKGADDFEWHRLGSLPAFADLESKGFRTGLVDLSVIGTGVETDAINTELRERGWSPSNLSAAAALPLPDGPGLLVRAAVASERVLQRAVAKIAFNYLAYHYGSVARMPQMEDVARFVRYGAQPGSSPVTATNDSFLVGLPEDSVPVAHAVGVSWRDNKLLGQVTLFCEIYYRVVLADGGFVIPPEFVSCGHAFDPINHRVVPLGRAS